MTDILIDARRGAGSSLEILYGTVTWKPTLTHSRGTSIVLPAPTTFDLVDGEVVATNVQPTPEPVEGKIEWAYEVTFKDRHSKSYSFLVGVPDSTTQVNFTSLPRYYETQPPLFGEGPQGDPGEAATIAVGTTTSGTTPNVTNSGTNTDAVLDFVLPEGPQGPKGDGVNTIAPKPMSDTPITYPMGYSMFWTGTDAALGWPFLRAQVVTVRSAYDRASQTIYNTSVGSGTIVLTRESVGSTSGDGGWGPFKEYAWTDIATTTANGLMSSADKSKLDNVGTLAYSSKLATDAPSTYPDGTTTGLFAQSGGWPNLGLGFAVVTTHKPRTFSSVIQYAAPYSTETSPATEPVVMFRSGSTGSGIWSEWQTIASQEHVTSRTGAVTPEQYGAVGNGTNDDSDAIETAINENLTTGRKILFDSSKTYRITRPIISTVPTNITQKYSIDLDSTSGSKATIRMDNNGHRHFDFSGAEIGNSVSLTENTSIQNRGWRVSSTSGFQKGMLMAVVSSQSWYYDPRPESTDARVSELHSVLSKEGNVIYSEAPAGEGYSLATNTVTVTPIVPITVNIKNLILTRPTPPVVAPDADLPYVGIKIAYARDSYVRDCVVENACTVGVQIRYCYNTVVESCKIDGTNAWATGYGVSFASTNFCTLRNTYITNTKKAVDVTAAGNVVGRNTVMEGNTFVGGGKNVRGEWFGWHPETQALSASTLGFGGHAVCADTIIRNNVTFNCWYPYQARGANAVISDNVHYGDTRTGVVSLNNGGGTILVTGNKAVSGWLGTQKYVFGANERRAREFINLGDGLDDNARVRVMGNYAEVREGFICTGNRLNATTKLVRFLTVLGNSVGFSNGTTDSGALLDNPSGTLVAIGGSHHWQIGANSMMHDTLAGSALLTRNLDISGAQVINWSTSGTTT